MSRFIRILLTALWRFKKFCAWCLDLDRPAWVFFPALFGIGGLAVFVVMATAVTVGTLTHPIVGVFAALGIMLAIPALAYWLRDGDK